MTFVTRRPPPQGAEAEEMARRKLRMRSWWDWVERCLSAYVFVWNPSEFFRCFREREGLWVLLRFILLGVFTAMAAVFDHLIYMAVWAASLLAIDILLFNTGVVFVSARPLNLLRSNVFTAFGYVSLALAFSPFWLWFHCSRGSAIARILDAIYQSVRTLTTAGPEGPLSSGERFRRRHWRCGTSHQLQSVPVCGGRMKHGADGEEHDSHEIEHIQPPKVARPEAQITRSHGKQTVGSLDEPIRTDAPQAGAARPRPIHGTGGFSGRCGKPQLLSPA